MQTGGERLLTVPPAKGYGNKKQASIPPNSTLTFGEFRRVRASRLQLTQLYRGQGRRDQLNMLLMLDQDLR